MKYMCEIHSLPRSRHLAHGIAGATKVYRTFIVEDAGRAKKKGKIKEKKKVSGGVCKCTAQAQQGPGG